MGVARLEGGGTASCFVSTRCACMALISPSGGKSRLGVAHSRRRGLGVAVLAFSVGLLRACSNGERRTRFRGGETGIGLFETASHS